MGNRIGWNPYWRAIIAGLAILFWWPGKQTWCQEPPLPSDKLTSSYFRQLELPRQESWFRRELRRFRTYPHLDRAYRLMTQEKYPAAKDELEKCLSVDPQNLEARYAYLTTLYKMKQYQGVVEQAKYILDRLPSFVPARLYLGLAHQALGQIDLAIAAFRQAIETPGIDQSNKTFALRTLADLYILKGDHSQAWEVLERERPVPQDFAFLYRRGLALQGLGRWSEAEETFSQAEKLARDTRERLQVLLSLAEVNKKRQNWNKVRQIYETALSLDPDNIEILRGLAQIAYIQRDYQAAAGAIRQALSRRDNPEDRLFLANLLEALKDHQKQIQELKQLLAQDHPPETRRRLLLQLGYAYGKVGEHKEAARSFSEAAKIRADEEVLLALAQSQERGGFFHQALQTLQGLLKTRPSAKAHFYLAMLYEKRHEPQKTLEHVEQVMKMGLPQEYLPQIYRLKAQAYQNLGEDQKAIQLWEKTLTARPRDEALLSSLVESALKLSDFQKALAYLERLVALETVPSRKAKLLSRQGHLLTKLGRDQEAARYFQQALAVGGDDPQVNLNLAFVLFKLRKFSEAAAHFRRVWERQPDLQALLGLARCYHNMNKPGLAIHYYETALPLVNKAPVSTQLEVYNSLGYLYAAEHEYGKAARFWQKSLTFHYDPVIALRLGRVTRLLEYYPEAEKILTQISPEQLTPALQAERWEELARVLWAQEKKNQALEALHQALQLDANASRYHLLGLYYLKLKEASKAISPLQKAVSLDSENPTYRETLGYALAAAKDYGQAALQLEKVLIIDPDYPKLFEDLGYLHLKAVNNERAIQWFKRAIDYQNRYGQDLGLTPQKHREEVYRLKKEVHKLANRVDFTAYMGFRSDRRQQSVPQGLLGGGALPSQGGLEVAFQPPVLGFRNERQCQVFHRVLWNIKPRSLRIDGDSFQGGVGLRYKPFRFMNFWTWAERLYKIGDNSRDNWLLRLLCSWDLGYDLKPARPWWNYTFLYGDVAYFTRHPDTWTYYAELRQGLTFNFRDTFLLTPHVIADCRYQDPWLATSSYAEAGLGLSLKYLFWETEYESHHGNLEILTYFKSGRFLNKGGGLSGNSLNGWFITGIWSF